MMAGPLETQKPGSDLWNEAPQSEHSVLSSFIKMWIFKDK